ALLIASGAPVQAQQSELELLRAQIGELTARLSKLEEEQSTAAAAAKTKAASSPNVTSKLPLQITGLFQIHSLNYFSQNGPAADANDTFRLRRGEIRLTAPTITPRISATAQLDFAKASSRLRVPAIPAGGGAVPVQNLDTRARDSVLQELQISYLLNKGTNGSSYIDVGQYKIPIGYESLVSSSALPLVDRALIFTQRDPFDGSYGDQRDTGVQLRGSRGPIDYRLGVFNGFGDRQNALALSDPKAVLGRLAYRSPQGFEVGVSGGVGNTGTGAGAPRADRNLFNVFGAYKKNKLSFQAEYLTGDAQLQTGASARDISGYYGQVGYAFTPKIEGIFRYDYLDANRQAAAGVDSKVRDLILGVNYYIKGNNAKIQTNLVRRSGAQGLPPAGGGGLTSDIVNDRTELRTNFQIAF
ncbi:MAG TPA: porin, partial [Abditibacteriaceae bacterium]